MFGSACSTTQLDHCDAKRMRCDAHAIQTIAPWSS
jgi:hypothetical protein